MQNNYQPSVYVEVIPEKNMWTVPSPRREKLVDNRMSAKNLHQLEVKMCCEKCEEKVLEEIWEVPGVLDVRAYWKENKVIVTGMPEPTGLDKDKVLRKARKIDCTARFVEHNPKLERQPGPNWEGRQPQLVPIPNLLGRIPYRYYRSIAHMPSEYRPWEQYQRGGYLDKDHEVLRKARKIDRESRFVDHDPNERLSDPKPKPVVPKLISKWGPQGKFSQPLYQNKIQTVRRPTEYRSEPSITGYEPQPVTQIRPEPSFGEYPQSGNTPFYFLLFVLLVVSMFYIIIS